MLRTSLIVAAVLALAACTEKRQTAMTICKELEAAGLAERCHDTSGTVCKYARERATFYTPGGDERAAGQVLRFANEAQFNNMTRITGLAKSAKTIESRTALTLVQFPGEVAEDVTQKAGVIVQKLPAVPSSEVAPDPTCAK